MTGYDLKLLGGFLGVVFMFVGVNGLGYVLLGDTPGNTSAQGGQGLAFMISLVAAPAGFVAGVLAGRSLARRWNRP